MNQPDSRWVAVAIMLLSLSLGSDLVDSLSTRGLVPQADLFSRGLLWDQDSPKDSLRRYILNHDFDRYRQEVNKQYPNLGNAPVSVRYDYSVACYQLQDMPGLKQALLTLSSDVLSAMDKDNVRIMASRVLYSDGLLKHVEDDYISVSNDTAVSKAAIKSIELIRDALFVKLMKPTVFPDKHPYISYRVGVAQLEKGLFDDARQSFLKAEISEDHRFIAYIKGLKSLQSEQFQEALDSFTAALGDPELDQELKYRRVEALFGLGRFEDVLLAVREYREQYADMGAYIQWVDLYDCLANIHLGQSDKVHQKLATLAATFPFLNYYLGQEALLAGHDEDAVNYFQRAAVAFNDSIVNQTRVLYALAWAEFRAGQYVAAKDHFTQFLKRAEVGESKHIIALMKLGDSSYNIHSYKEAAKEYSVVLSNLESRKMQYPEFYAKALINQARILGKLRQTGAAVELLDAYIQCSVVAEDKQAALKMKADLYAQDNALEKANQALTILIDQYGAINEDVYMALADNRFNLNQFEGALATYQKCLTLFPKGDRRMDARYGEVQSLIHLKKYDQALIEAGYTDGEFGSQLYLEVEKTIELMKQQEPSK